MLQPKSNRLFYADLLRAIAIFAVIILHNAADYDDQLGDIPASHWWAGTIWNGLVRFCVPMFVVLSGAFLLKQNKEVTISEVFKKRLPRIVIPLIFWSLVYILYNGYTSDGGIAGVSWKEQLKVFYQGPVAYHLWFLYMLIGIYLLYPIINLFITAAKEIHIRYFLIVWFLSNCIINIFDAVNDTTFGVGLNFFAEYAGYFVLGFYLANYTFTKRQLSFVYVLGVAGLLLSVFMASICMHFQYADRATLIESDFTPDIVMTVAALFLWFRNRTYPETPGIVSKMISQVSKESFGIYLIHVLVMEIIFSDDRSYADVVDAWHPGWGIPLKAILVLVISFVIVKILSYIPLLKKVIG